MYCPQCGQNQISNDVRYCSRCGFLLTGVTHLLATGGVLPPTNATGKRQKTKQRGVKQGVLMMMLATIIVSLIAALGGGKSDAMEAAIFFSLVGHLGGLMRIIYSLLFLPSATPGNFNQSSLEPAYAPPSPASFKAAPPQPAAALPPHAPRVSLFDKVRRRHTGELVAPPSSITDHTTRLLKQEPKSRSQKPEVRSQNEEGVNRE